MLEDGKGREAERKNKGKEDIHHTGKGHFPALSGWEGGRSGWFMLGLSGGQRREVQRALARG